MAQYIYDPSTKATDLDIQDDGWTAIVSFSAIIKNTASPVGSKVAEYIRTIGYRRIAWTTGGPPVETTDVRILSLWRSSATNIGQGNIHRISADFNTSYYWGFRNADTDVLGRRYTGPFNQITLSQAGTGFTRAANTWYWVESESVGTTHKVRAWEHGTTKPDWQVTQTEATLSSGFVGLGDFHGTSNAVCEMAWYSVGTDGDPAPEPISAGITLSPASMRSASRLASPSLTQAHTIQPDDARSVSRLDTVQVNQANIISPSDARSVSRLDTVQINQANIISPSDARSETVLDATELTQANNLDPDDARSASRLAASLLTQSNIISPADLASASELDASSLTQNGLLNPADSRSVSRLDASVLMQDHIISPDDARSVSRLSVATLIAQGSISPDGLRCGTRLDSVLLVQANQLAPADLLSASRLDPVVVTQANVLQPDGVFSPSKLSAVQLTMAILVSPDSLWSAARLDSGSLTQANQLTVDDLVSPSRLQTTNLFLIDAEVLGQLMVLPARRTMFNLPKRGTTFYLSGRN